MTIQPVIETGAVVEIPLSKLKKSPRNARKTPHGEAAIEALAASIAAKGLLQAPVVEPELSEGEPTGFYLVTIGEGRRLALCLRAKRKEIRKSEPVRCVVDVTNDPHEISLDENVTRTEMHPADQFEAFKRLAEERGFGAEEIGARFGVSAQVVRQRLRLGAVSPKLMGLYREGELTLDQLMAFALSEDHARQEQVHEQLSWNKSPQAIRRAMTEQKVAASDRRAVFVGAEAYTDAGGTILRDLFTEDGGGWLEDVALLDKLVSEKLDDLAREVLEAEGWKWAEAHIDYPHAHGFGRVYPKPVERTQAQEAEIAALSEEYDALVSEWDAVEDLPSEVEARLRDLEAALQSSRDAVAYDPTDVARGGVFVVLGYDGQPRIERGLIRQEDELLLEATEAEEVEAPAAEGEVPPATDREGDVEDEEPDGLTPLSERLVLDLTAHRTLGLRDALAGNPNLALVAVVHALALRSFYPPYDQPSCLEIKTSSAYLEGRAPGIMESAGGRKIAERHDAWAARMPRETADAWGFVASLDGTALLDLLAHCASLTINAVHSPLDRRPGAWAHADTLAGAAGLDMTGYWRPTARTYLGRITKARIVEAVREAVSEEAAERIAGLKKGEMAEAAKQLLAGTGWLPPLLRTPRAHPEPEAHAVYLAAAE